MTSIEPAPEDQTIEKAATTLNEIPPRPWYRIEDFLAMGLGAFIIVVAALISMVNRPANMSELVQDHQAIKSQMKKLDPDSDSLLPIESNR